MTETISLNIEDEEIVFADLTNRNNLEVIIICKSNNIFLFDCKTNSNLLITKLSFPSDILNLQIHSFQNYACIVQKNGTKGMVINLSNPDHQKYLERGNYHPENCLFPIAFYTNDNQTFLIHGTDWNRLDITCLETDELLTERIIDYETKSNYLDYFHSFLLISPDSKTFTSNGWVWSPMDIITVYSIDRFLREFERAFTNVEFARTSGYNWDRPLCWIDDATLGIGYNKKEEDENEGEFPSEIICFNIVENEVINRIEFNGFLLADYGEVKGELFFDEQKQYFIGLNEQSGILITDTDGKELYKDTDLVSHKYSKKHKIFYHINSQNQTIEIINLDEPLIN